MVGGRPASARAPDLLTVRGRRALADTARASGHRIFREAFGYLWRHAPSATSFWRRRLHARRDRRIWIRVLRGACTACQFRCRRVARFIYGARRTGRALGGFLAERLLVGPHRRWYLAVRHRSARSCRLLLRLSLAGSHYGLVSTSAPLSSALVDGSRVLHGAEHRRVSRRAMAEALNGLGSFAGVVSRSLLAAQRATLRAGLRELAALTILTVVRRLLQLGALPSSLRLELRQDLAVAETS